MMYHVEIIFLVAAAFYGHGEAAPTGRTVEGEDYGRGARLLSCPDSAQQFDDFCACPKGSQCIGPLKEGSACAFGKALH